MCINGFTGENENEIISFDDCIGECECEGQAC